MSFFKRLFGGDSEDSQDVKPTSLRKNSGTKALQTLHFGRYTDCNKDANQLAYWNKSVQAFKEKRYVDSFEAFLNYAKDHELNNITITRTANSVEFKLIQGSSIITGIGNEKEFTAQTNIAEMPEPSIPVMRKLMAINFGLRYSKFALNGTTICMKFSSHAVDASAGKLYAGLKELAKKADQQDDLLIAEFSSLKEIGGEHVEPTDSRHIEIKYKYLLKWVNDTKAEVAKMDPQKMYGGIAFLLLELSYKIDYLIAPQGKLTNSLELIQLDFFKKSNATTVERNAQIMREFDAIIAQPKEKLIAGLYDVKCTFGIANPASHKVVMDKMFEERNKVAWYRDNGYSKVQQAIYGYMISYAFFNYGMVYPVTDVLNIAQHVLNPDYYREMGDQNQFVDENKGLNRKAIIAAINQSMTKALKDYPFIRFNAETLNFTSPSNFIDSLILELDKLDLRKN